MINFADISKMLALTHATNLLYFLLVSKFGLNSSEKLQSMKG